jgi:transposase
MARKSYSAEFRRDAVELYRVTEAATITQIAADLGVVDATLASWLRAAGVPVRHGRGGGPATAVASVASGDELARLRAENEALRARERTLETERDILRAAAKYFAGETNW